MKIYAQKEGNHPRPIAAYFPFLPRMKSVAAIPPNTPPERSDAPSMPSAAKYGVPEPSAPSLFAISTLDFEVSISWYIPLSRTSYCANAGCANVTINAARNSPERIVYFCMSV